MNITYIKRSMYTALGCLVFLLVAGSAHAGICPAFGAASDCGVQINVTAQSGGVGTAYNVMAGPSGNGNPYDGIEDTLVGLTNNSGATITSITLTASLASDAFGWDGDGPCFNGCPLGSTGYEGPNMTFSAVTNNGTNEFLTITFTGNGLANGASTYFALEGTPSSIIGGSNTPEPGTFLLLGTGLLGLGLLVRRSL